MAHVSPFRGWRVSPEQAASVAAVPYDVVNRDEARALTVNNPLSFLHVTKPEVDLPVAMEPTDAEVYAKGADNLQKLIHDGVLRHDTAPCYYAYALTHGAHRQVGVVLAASVADYETNLVRKHEHTRPDKENDRVRHMEVLGAQSGKVFLVHKAHQGIAQILASVTQGQPVVDFVATDGVAHQMWVISAPAHVQTLTCGFAEVGPLYIADGHHRAAAAARVAAGARARGQRDTPECENILAVAFAADQVQILAYHRVVRDLAGLTAERFLLALSDRFVVQPGKQAPAPRQFGMYLGGAWYTLALRARATSSDVTQLLDVSILQDQVLAPLLQITDPRRDKRIDFVGGARGDAELEKRVHNGWAVAFSLYPTALVDLFNIADAGAVMPPKSTWFEPKLRDGLVVLRFTA